MVLYIKHINGGFSFLTGFQTMKNAVKTGLSLFLFSQLQASGLLDLKLEDLTQVEITNTFASLTETENRDTPAAVTVITSQDIRESGARSLDELLDIYVPSFAYMYKVYGSQMGMRGILSDRNNKILLLVNNRVMNIRTSDSGAVTERWLSMLGDIRRVTVITGPGSPIYGSGAIAGVIKIETFSGEESRGFEVGGKAGTGENFAMAELSYAGEMFGDSRFYLYYGVDRYYGANEDKAPMQFAFDYNGPYWWNSDIVAPADEPYPYATTNDAASLDHQLRHKVHLQLQNDNLLLWARFTRSSLESPAEQKMFQWLTVKNADRYRHTGTENQQLTLFGEYRSRPAKDLFVDYDLSYQRSSLYSRQIPDATSLGLKAWREDNFVAKINARYTYDDDNLFAFGSEYTHNWLGKSSEIGFTDFSYINKDLNSTEWGTDQLSFFGEYQKHFDGAFTVFAGIRADRHSYLDWIYSPRISLVCNLDNEDVFKLSWSRSNRYSDEAELYLDHLHHEAKEDVEEIDTLEFIYTKYLSDWKIELSTFYNEHEVIAYNASRMRTTDLGKIHSYGGELRVHYQTDRYLFDFSHSYTKLKEFTLSDPDTEIQNISAMPYGFGDDFANWNTHITKVRFDWQLTKRLKWINSLRVFWGLPGGRDMANYNKSLANKPPELYKLPYYQGGHTGAFEESVYYNTSLLWDVDERTSVGLYGYNLAGIFNRKYNKRNFYQYTSQYRLTAPSLAFGIRYKFN